MVTTGFGPFSLGCGSLDARGFWNPGLSKRDAGGRVLVLGMIEHAFTRRSLSFRGQLQRSRAGLRRLRREPRRDEQLTQ